MTQPIERELFLDDDQVESMQGLRRTLHQPRKHAGNPVVRPHAPWLKNAFLFGSVVREPDRWRMWYHAEVDSGRPPGDDRFARYAACYAESTDGLQWRYPELDVFVHNGRGTNVVLHRDQFPGYGEIYSVVPQPPDYSGPDRYAAMFNLLWHREDASPLHAAATLAGLRRPDWYRSDWAHGGMMLARSPDGIHWTATYPYTLDYPADISHMLYDARIGKFVIYGRQLAPPAYRTVQRLESKDLAAWDPPRTRQVFDVDERDPPDTQVYSMPVMVCGAQYVGFPQMYHLPSGILEFQLATSRDGVRWTRVAERATWLPVGDPGDWDRFNNAMASAPVRVGNELWFYIAWVPQGRYPNRMIDSQAIKSRVLHWLNATYDTTGYLHWALNHWQIPLSSLESPGDQYICWPSRRFIANSSLLRFTLPRK